MKYLTQNGIGVNDCSGMNGARCKCAAEATQGQRVKAAQHRA